ncbi:MAG: hypothetical protein R3F46_05830 [bacterium]
MLLRFLLTVLLQFLLSCAFVSLLLPPLGRLLGQTWLGLRRSLQCGLGFASFQLISVLLFALAITVMGQPLDAPPMLRLGLVWVSLPLLLISPLLFSLSTGWRRGPGIAAGLLLSLGWILLQYALGTYLLRGA